MKVYVACSSAEIDRAESMIAALTALGGTCTYDWTKVMRSNAPDHELTDEVLLPELRNDVHRGVMLAELFVFLAPCSTSTGVYVELGAAMVRQRQGDIEIHVVGPSPHAWARAAATARHADDDRFASWFAGEMSVMRAHRGHA